MPEIRISVRNRTAKNVHNDTYVCGNGDFKAVFDFDAEWEQFQVKTARIKHDGVYQDVIFTGNECPIPIIENTFKIYIGIFAGNLFTTTPALVVASKCIRCGDEPHEEPEQDVYNQIIEKIDNGMLRGPQGPAGPQGPKGADGTMTFEDLTEEQKESLRGETGPAGAKGEPGADGAAGKDGTTPTIGANGNWYLGDTDTGKPSRGEAGAKGADGANGKDGAKGDKGDKGDAFTYADFTAEQLAALKGEKGDKGATGQTGPQGPKGDPGPAYTLTDADKTSIVNATLAALPAWTGGTY